LRFAACCGRDRSKDRGCEIAFDHGEVPGDQIAFSTTPNGVAAVATYERIAVGATLDPVLTGSAIDEIIAVAAVQVVVRAPCLQSVIVVVAKGNDPARAHVSQPIVAIPEVDFKRREDPGTNIHEVVAVCHVGNQDSARRRIHVHKYPELATNV